MAAHLFAVPKEVEDTEPSVFSITADAFSVKVTADGDAFFFVRLEKTGRGEVVVSDFVGGSQAEEDLILALDYALRDLRAGGLERLIFRDLVPCGMEDGRFGYKLERASELAKRASDRLATRYGCTVRSFAVEPRAGKMDAHVGFAAA
ncbi:hypothetical protein NYQ83_07920 [Afifella sp. JA880]|uniref:hypothetical protein n=1 Tax=Afifella sp. JA880 TaxID=2975280 RepID=UPI0021BB5AEB|nr:hypothetical protein [Afifella sp. JA880]MCT8267197.1 hypothetical protein [Afifella sp. JA880]